MVLEVDGESYPVGGLLGVGVFLGFYHVVTTGISRVGDHHTWT